MAEMDFCSDRKVWTKTCPTCKVIFEGFRAWEEAQKTFLSIFGEAQRQADGLQANCKECAKNNRRRRKGVADGYNEIEMYKEQQGKCCLCTIELFMPYRYPADPQGARVDHDHKTGRVRGLLCHRCNAMIGMYEATMEVFPEFDLSVVDKYIDKGQ